MGPDGVTAPGWLELDLTDPQLDALINGGHVEDWTGVDGWGEDDTPDAGTEAGGAATADTTEATGQADEPKAGTEKEGN
jgi:hypothetical protein